MMPTDEGIERDQLLQLRQSIPQCGPLPEQFPVPVTPYIKEVMPADLDSESRTPPDADEEVPSTPASGERNHKKKLRPVRLSTLAKPATTEDDRTRYEQSDPEVW